MNTLLRKKFCLWLVSPDDGRVKKLRFSLGGIGTVVLSLSLVGAVSLFGIGRFTHSELIRVSEQLSLQRMTSERNTLRHSNHSLQSALQRLESENDRARSFEENVRDRLKELDTILSTARGMGILPKQKVPFPKDHARSGEIEVARANPPEKDVAHQDEQNLDEGDSGSALGGLETECTGPECLPGFVEALGTGAIYTGEGKPDEGSVLVEEMDYYVEALRGVPIGSPTGRGRISSGYGVRVSPFSRRVRMHHGLDLALPHGSDVFVTADGVVKDVRRHSTYGLKIDVQHSNGTVTRYAHLSQALVNPGQRVVRSQLIGKVGSSGLSTGPHLHYEIRVNGKTKNPLPLVTLGDKLAALEPFA